MRSCGGGCRGGGVCIEIAARPFVEWPRSRFEHDLCVCVSVFVTGLSGIEILCVR